MPRRARGETTKLPPRHVRILTAAVVNPRLSHPAFRLLGLVAAYSWETGGCDLNNQQLAEMLGVSRQFVSRLIGENKSYGLMVEKTLQGRRFLQPVDGTIGDADSPSRTPHGLLSTTDNTVLSTTDNINDVEEESIKSNKDSSSSRGVLSTTDNINDYMLSVVDNSGIDAAFGRVAARWCHYFGDISPAVADLLGDFLDDPDLARLAGAAEELPEAWLRAAIEETGLAEARNPAKYFRKVLSDWIRRGFRTPPQGDNGNGASGSDHQQDEPVSLDGRQLIEAILDRFEAGELSRDDAKQQLAAYGVVL